MIMDMAKLLRQFQKLQGDFKKIQKEIAKEKVTGSSGGGMVEVTVNGKLEVIDVQIEKKLLEEKDAEMLEDLILAATNKAIFKAQQLVKEKMGHLAGGLNIPGMEVPGMFG